MSRRSDFVCTFFIIFLVRDECLGSPHYLANVYLKFLSEKI